MGGDIMDRLANYERRWRSRAFFEHRRRQARDAELARRIRRGSAQHNEVHVRDGDFVQLDDPHRQTVRELPLLNLRQGQRWRWAWLRRPAAVGGLLRDERDGQRKATAEHPEHAEKTFLCGLCSPGG